MPIQSTITDGIIYTELSGVINYDAVICQIDFIYALKDTLIHRYELHDHTNTESIRLSAEEISKIASYSQKTTNIFNRSVLAVYAPTDFTFGVARMFDAFFKMEEHSIESEIFRQKEDAITFLMNKRKLYG